MFNNIISAESTTNSSSWIMLVVLGVLMVGMILMTIIPQRKKQKQAQQMMSALKKGDQIKTIGGFVGTIVSIDSANNTMDINVGADGREIIVTIDKAAVYTVINPTPAQNFDNNKTIVADESVGVITADDKEADDKKAHKSSKKNKKNEVIDNNEDISIDKDNNDVTF